jgi:hypothetical protein
LFFFRETAHENSLFEKPKNQNRPSALPGIAAAVGSLRSALCRAGLAAASDVAATFGSEEPWVIVGKTSEEAEAELRGLLPCLLSKAASNDKKFVVDAAAAALSVASATVPAEMLAPRLLDFVRAKPSLPRGRAASARALAEVVGNNESSLFSSSSEGRVLFDQLSAVASELSRDAWPPARQAARDLAAALAEAEKGEEEAQPPLSLAAAAAAPPPQSQQEKENAAVGFSAAAAFATAAPFSAAGKAMNVVVEAPAAAPPQQQQLLPPPWQQQTLGEHGGGNV